VERIGKEEKRKRGKEEKRKDKRLYLLSVPND
jgi:hypothetical protein